MGLYALKMSIWHGQDDDVRDMLKRGGASALAGLATHPATYAEIQLALNLDALTKTSEAKEHLGRLIAARPDDFEAIMALGNIERERKQFSECAETYARGIATIANPSRGNWPIFYFRGICYERAKQWPKA